MNQKVEQALVDYSNDVWDRAMKAGALAEQERIIKLIESQKCQCDEYCDSIETDGALLIALIKGEK